MQSIRRAGWFVCIFLVLGLWGPAPASAAESALDLIPDARLRVSGVAPQDGQIAMSRGRAALRDGNLNTAWVPAEGRSAWIEVGISSVGDDAAIRLDRVELFWGRGYPETVTVTAGPDPETQQVVARMPVTEPNHLTLSPALPLDDVRVVFLRFEGRGFSVAQLRLFASHAPELAALDRPKLSRRDGVVWIEATWPKGAHHLEIERVQEVGPPHVWRTTSPIIADRPPQPGVVHYRLRAVDYLGQPGNTQELGPVTIEAAAAASPLWRGVVEGFSGPPWSMRTRLDTLRQLGTWGFNTYIYAPKQDEKRRNSWKEAYGDEKLAHFAQLRELGEAVGVRTFFGVSPGQTIDPLSASDLGELVSKYAQLAALGYKDFVLLLDEGDTRIDAVSGANHATLVNRLRARLLDLEPDATLWFVPAVTSGMPGRFSADQRAYLNALKAIDDDVLIAWMGKEGVDEVIRAEEVETLSELVGHPVLLWDNYPANDTDLGLHLAPVRGREAALLNSESLAAVVINPMNEGLASWFVLASWAQLLADPEAYDPENVDLEDLGNIYDPSCNPAVWRQLRKLFSPFKDWEGMEESPELAAAVDAFAAQLFLGSLEEVNGTDQTLTHRIYEILKIADALEWSCTARGLSDELAVRLEILTGLSEGALLAVELLQADVFGWRQVFYDSDARLERLVSGPLSLTYPVLENTLRPLIDLARAPENDRPVKRLVGQARMEPIMADPLPYARVGQPWHYDAGFMLDPDGVNWAYSYDPSLNVALERSSGLFSATPEREGRFWLTMHAIRDTADVTRIFPITVLPALNELDSPTLPTTAELVTLDGVPVLLQNDIVVPDAATCQYPRMDLSGAWKKRRATVDRRLSFAARDRAVLERMEMEACGAHLPDFDDSDWEDMNLPAVENRLPSTGHSSGPEEYWGGVWYRREVPVPRGGQQIRLVMLAADYIVDAWADGRYLGWHEGGYSPVYLPLPQELSDRETLVLTLRVDRPRPGDIPGMLPASPDTRWWLYGGVVRDIYWEYLPASQEAAIARATVIPQSMTGQLQVDVVVEELKGVEQPLTVKIEAFQTDRSHSSYWAGASISGAITNTVDVTDNKATLVLEPGQRRALRLKPRIISGSPWEPLHPRIYAVRVRILDESGRTLDRYTVQTGLRELAVRDDGTLSFNNKQVFWPGLVRHEDSPSAGRSLDWRHTLYDLRLAKSRGAMFLRLGSHPHHPDAAIIADRLGLVVMSEIPTWALQGEAYSVQAERGLARQMWHEMIFQNINRPSVLFWGACDECLPEPDGGDLRDFVLGLRNDRDEFFPDGPMVTHSLRSDWYAHGGSESLNAVDVAGIAYGFGESADDTQTIRESVTDFLTRVREDFPQLPVLLTAYGAESFQDLSGSPKQMALLEGAWKGVQPVASVTENRRINVNGFVAGMAWWTLADSYSNAWGVQTMGLYGMDRSSWKPAADALRHYYYPYTRGPVLSSGRDIPARRSGVSECSSPGGDLAPVVWLLLLLGLALRRLRLKA